MASRKTSAQIRKQVSKKAKRKVAARKTRPAKRKKARSAKAKKAPARRHKPITPKQARTADDIAKVCSDIWPDNNLFCNKFVIAVAAKLGVTLSGVADKIVDEIAGPGWTPLDYDGAAAAAAAEQGKLVIGAQKGSKHVPPADEGHVVVVVKGDLAFDKYPTAFWGSDVDKIREKGGGDHTVNYAYNKDSRDSVNYASIDVSSKAFKRLASPSTFKGFEKARFQAHDDDIVDLVDTFNGDKSWIGATPDQAKAIPDIPYDLVKSWIIQETGGSPDAWAVDPAQVNVPGDWNDYKSSLGLTKPDHVNTGDLRTNLKAAIGYLARKGFGESGQPPSNRPDAFFEDWPTALQRYNGRSGGYKERYAKRITDRANDPGTYYPIEGLARLPKKKR